MGKLFEELAALKASYDKKLAEEGESSLKEMFKEFFEAHPKVEDVHWHQYTPYFNDGDPCYFGVYDFYVTLADSDEETSSDEDEDEDEDYYDDECDSYTLSRSGDPEIKKIGEALESLQDIPEDVLESVFGDHCKIVATRDGFKVSEYSHD